MVHDPVTGSLIPIDFKHITDHVPVLGNFGYDLQSVSFDPVKDSSNIDPDIWIKLAEIIEKNYVCKMGEMDIIAREKDTLVFIEVKTRTSMAFGPPQLAVNSTKQMQLSKVAL